MAVDGVACRVLAPIAGRGHTVVVVAVAAEPVPAHCQARLARFQPP